MTNILKTTALAAFLATAVTGANAAIIDFEGNYQVTTDADSSDSLSAGDTFTLSAIAIDSIVGVPGVDTADTIADISITASVGANIGSIFDITSTSDDFTVSSTTTAVSVLGVFTLVTGGLGSLGADAGSWFIAMTNGNLSGSFLGKIETPPGTIPGAPIPLPAGAPLLIGALGALAYLRRKAA